MFTPDELANSKLKGKPSRGITKQQLDPQRVSAMKSNIDKPINLNSNKMSF